MYSRKSVLWSAFKVFMALAVFGLVLLMGTGAFAKEVLRKEGKAVVPFSQPRKVMATVTGYSVDTRQCGKTDGITAAGRDGRKVHGVAAAPNLLPLGTRIYIPGVGERVVDDTGGDMRKAARNGQYHIDLRMLGRSDKEAKKKAVAWGRQTLEITILEMPPKKEKVVKKKVPATARVVQVATLFNYL